MISKKFASFAVLALFTSSLCAWDGAVTGKIGAIDVTGGGNYGVRIYLSSGAQLCTGGPNWAFLNDTDSNYKAYVAALLLARAQGLTVTLYTTLDGAGCRIGYLSVRD